MPKDVHLGGWRVPDAVQRPLRCAAEPRPWEIRLGINPGSQRTTPQERRAAQHPGHANTRSPSRGAMRPRLAAHVPPEIRGRSATPRGEQGKPGARCTRSRACRIEGMRVSHHRFTGAPAFPAQWF